MKRMILFCATLALVVQLTTVANAATIDAITLVPLSGGNYQKPGGLLTGGQLDQLYGPVGDLTTSLGQSVRGYRNNSQTFTIGATDYPMGVDVEAFVMNFRNRSNTVSFPIGARLFRVNETTLSGSGDLVSIGPDLVYNASGLNFPTRAANGGEAHGTVVFEFDTAVHLEPGGLYAWQFLLPGYDVPGGSTSDPNNSSNNLVWWSNDDAANTYPYGDSFQSITPSSAGGSIRVSSTNDNRFGLIGTATVPEPSTMVLAGLALVGLAYRRVCR